MSSPPPPDAPEEHGFFHSIKSRLRRVKDTKESPDSSSRGSGLLSPSSSSFRLLSRSRSTTPTPGTRPLLRDSGERAPVPSLEPPAEVSLASTAVINPQRSPANTTWSRLESSLRTLEKGTKSIPGLNSALNAFIGCLDSAQIAASNREEYEQLAEELTSMVDGLHQYTGELGSGSNTSIANIVQSIEDQITSIRQQQERSTLRHLLDATDSQEDVIRHYRRIEALFRQLQVSTLGIADPVGSYSPS
ncbi:putative vegetative incompatibility protein HET-E-1 [Rhizoctonia solani 123E]|uniref:Putative vegetative incompatibility protein HET-E-1 n=1 Tax=Rhizoctonia solani 123E TaxID=1423351 RepID=A0A074RHW8_9AGAM|nr:putative vegetative incompatibility protein HET-E-1 [Rhizoctonia solani 123E]